MRLSVIIAVLASAAVFAAPIQGVELGEEFESIGLENSEVELRLPSGLAKAAAGAIGSAAKKVGGTLVEWGKKALGKVVEGAGQGLGAAATTASIDKAKEMAKP